MLRDFHADNFDVVIQAGQSNAAGYGIGDVSEPYVPGGKVWFLNQDFTISMAQEHCLDSHAAADFSLTFAEEYIRNGRLANDRQLLIVRSAVGGTGFSDKNWGMKDPLYLQMMEMTRTALALNRENRLTALLWHQGETDAKNAASEDTHYMHLCTLVTAVRTAFGYSTLPFVAGDFVQQWKAGQNNMVDPVVAAIRKVCADVGCAGFVETDGLMSNDQKTGNGDTIHFCREALYRLGKRYYAAFSDIICMERTVCDGG